MPRLAVLALLAWAAGASAAGCDDPAAVVLPTTDGPQASIPVGIEETSRSFVLDTGSPVSIIRESVVAELGLKHEPIPLDAVAGASGHAFQERAIVPAVTLGSRRLTDVPFLIEPRSHGPGELGAGVAGADLLAGGDLELDFAHHRAVLRAAGSCRPPGMAALPMTVTRTRHALVRVDLDGARANALIDSGAFQSLLRLDAAHALFGLDLPQLARVGDVVSIDGGHVAAYTHPFQRLSLGTIVFADPPIVIIPDETRHMHRPLSLTDTTPDDGLPEMILGLPLLRRMHLILAYAEGKLYVAPAETP